MCEDCNQIEIPQGPQGDPGTNGTNGVDGINGTSILFAYNDILGTNSGSGTSEVVLKSYTIPQNTLVNNGDEIELHANLSYTAPELVTLRFKLAGLNIVTYNLQDNDNLNILLKIKISKTSTGNQMVESIELSRKSDIAKTTIMDISLVNTTLNETVTNTIQLTAQNNQAIANQLFLSKFVVYKYKI